MNVSLKDPKLAPHLVPKPLWGKSAFRLFGRRTLWKQMRTDALEVAHHTCEICGDTPSPICGDPLNCHEVWVYDDKRGKATLESLRIQCSKCDAVVHMGRTVAHGGRDAAISQLCKINGLSTKQAEKLYVRAMATWAKRSKKKWQIAVAQHLLEWYPQLIQLVELKPSRSPSKPS